MAASTRIIFTSPPSCPQCCQQIVPRKGDICRTCTAKEAR